MGKVPYVTDSLSGFHEKKEKRFLISKIYMNIFLNVNQIRLTIFRASKSAQHWSQNGHFIPDILKF